MGLYQEINQQHRAMGRLKKRIDRRLVAKAREAFDRSSDRAHELCYLSCAGCGHLIAPRPVDPNRDGSALIGPCRHCNTRVWLDLTEDEAARQLAAVESYEVQTTDLGKHAGSWTIRIGGALTMLAICFFAITNSYSAIFSGLTAILCVLAVPYFLFGYGHATKMERRELPYRWALPLPPVRTVDDSKPRIVGLAHATEDATRRAPFSGRSCLGYRVMVQRADQPMMAVPSLVAQDAVDLEVDGQRIAADHTRLDLPLAEVTLDPEHRDEAVRYLRRVGIFETDGEWRFFEAVLCAGQRVAVAPARGGGAILSLPE